MFPNDRQFTEIVTNQHFLWLKQNAGGAGLLSCAM